jgi:hypothetical protein
VLKAETTAVGLGYGLLAVRTTDAKREEAKGATEAHSRDRGVLAGVRVRCHHCREVCDTMQ